MIEFVCCKNKLEKRTFEVLALTPKSIDGLITYCVNFSCVSLLQLILMTMMMVEVNWSLMIVLKLMVDLQPHDVDC